MERQLKKGFREFMAEAADKVEVVEVDEALKMASDPDVQFIDVRDRYELMESGKITGAEHASRGMIEFAVDPSSPFHNKIFNEDKRFVIYCGSGGRSTLAAYRMKEMGIDKVYTMSGGFKAWKQQGGAIEPLE